MDVAMTILKVTLLTPIIICGVIGNLLVCISVFKFRNLRIVANYFIVSLAVADLAVCSVVMPLGLYQEVVGGLWYLGPIICDVWVTMDVLTCTSSIWNLCLISVEPLLGHHTPNPVRYQENTLHVSSFHPVNVGIILSYLHTRPCAGWRL